MNSSFDHVCKNGRFHSFPGDIAFSAEKSKAQLAWNLKKRVRRAKSACEDMAVCRYRKASNERFRCGIRNISSFRGENVPPVRENALERTAGRRLHEKRIFVDCRRGSARNAHSETFQNVQDAGCAMQRGQLSQFGKTSPSVTTSKRR